MRKPEEGTMLVGNCAHCGKPMDVDHIVSVGGEDYHEGTCDPESREKAAQEQMATQHIAKASYFEFAPT